MMQFIRSSLGSIVVKALFVLLIASFAVWGVGDIFGGPPAGRPAVEVADVQISTQTVADEFDRQRQRFGPQLDPRTAIEIGLLDQVFQQLSTEALLSVESDRLGLGVGEEQVARYIRERFTDDTGAFSRSAYETYLFNQRQNEAQFVASLTDDLTRLQLLGALASDPSVPRAVVDRLFQYRETRRAAQVVVIDPAALPAPVLPGEATLQTFYEERREDYRAPEYRAVTWVEVTPATVADRIEIDEEALRTAYEEQIGRFTVEGTRTVDQMFFAEQSEAQAARDRIGAGETFEEVAMDAAGMDAEMIGLGTLSRGDLPDGTQDAVFGLQAGGISEPVQSPLGWHLFRVTEATPGSTESFESVAAVLREELALDRAADLVFETANELEDQLAGGATLREAAAALDLPVRSVAAVSGSGATPAGVPDPTLPGGDFLELAFETPDGQQSVLGEAGDGFFVLRVDGVDPDRVPPLSEIRERVVEDWERETRFEDAETLADTLAQSIEDGSSPAFLAASRRLRLVELPAITRNGADLPDGYPQTLASALFGIDRVGGAAVAGGPDAVYVLRLTDIREPDGTASTEARARIEAQLADGLQQDIWRLLLTDLGDRYEVETDRNAVISVFTSAQQP